MTYETVDLDAVYPWVDKEIHEVLAAPGQFVAAVIVDVEEIGEAWILLGGREISGFPLYFTAYREIPVYENIRSFA